MKKVFKQIVLIALVVTGAMTSCQKENESLRLRREEAAYLSSYLKEVRAKGYDYVAHSSGYYLFQHDTMKVSEDSARIVAGSIVSIWYVGKTISGRIFSSNFSGKLRHEVLTFQMNNFSDSRQPSVSRFVGLHRALLSKRKGEKFFAIIPSSVGVGSLSIPPHLSRYTTAVLEVEVADVR